MLEAVRQFINTFHIKRKIPKGLFPTLLFKILVKCGVIEAKQKQVFHSLQNQTPWRAQVR